MTRKSLAPQLSRPLAAPRRHAGCENPRPAVLPSRACSQSQHQSARANNRTGRTTHERCAVLECLFALLNSENECAQVTTCSVGKPGARRSLGRAGAEYLPHNIVIGSVGAHARQSAARERHRCARLRRACGRSFRLRCSERLSFSLVLLRACACTSGHTLCSAVLTTETHQILCGKYPPLHASRPSRPRLSHCAVESDGRARRKVCRFAGEHDAGGFAAEWKRGERREQLECLSPRATSRVVRRRRRLLEWTV